METYLMITDTTGKQYPHKVDSTGIRIQDFLVTEENYNLDLIQNFMNNYDTIRINNRIFRTKSIIEISIHQIPTGAY
jgi:hypothetical protein